MKGMFASGIAAFMAFPGLAAGSSLASADAYVRWIYHSIPAERFDYRSVRYGSQLARLMARDDAYSKASDGVGAIDAVPFCECQDNDPNYAVVRTRVSLRGPDRAAVDVILRNGTLQHFSVDLVLQRGQWRVTDIHGPQTPSFLAYLRREVPRNEASLRRSVSH